MTIRRLKRTRRTSARGDMIFTGINTTPLVDVMLVLLVMMILSIPALTHKVPLDLPVPGHRDGPPPPVNELAIAINGALSWNGKPVSTAQLQSDLAAHVKSPEHPVLHLRSDPATRYESFDRTLGLVKHAGVTSLGFVNTLGDAPPDW
jgi:biopolymer transport protein ExbD